MARRAFIAAVVALLVIGGGYAAVALPFVWLPPPTGTRVQVLWQDPGASSVRIAETVARPLARALGDLDGVDELSATVTTGRVEIALTFEARARNPLAAVHQQLARTALPPGGEPIRVTVAGTSPEVVLIVSARTLGMPALTRWMRDALLPALRSLPAVATVAVDGTPEEQIVAIPDQRRLAGVGLAPEGIIQTLREAMRAGAPEAAREPSSRAAGLSALALRLPSGEVTALGEFTRFETVEVSPVQVSYDGAEALRVVVRGTPDALERTLVETVTSQLGWLRANGQLPDGLTVAPVEELYTTRVQARRSLQRAIAIGAFAALAVLFAVTASARALWGRTVLLLGMWGVVLVTWWITATPLSVPALGGMALAIGPVLALSYLRRVLARRGTAASPLFTGALFGSASMMVALAPWFFASGTLADHYRDLLLAFALALAVGVLIDALWSGRGRRRRSVAGGWRAESAAWFVATFEQWQRAIAASPWPARMLLLVLMASALLVVMALRYRDVPLDVYRPLVLEWLAPSPGARTLAIEDARLARALDGETGVLHREVSYLDPSHTLDGRAWMRARLGVEPGRDDPAWRAQLLARLAGGGLTGLRLLVDADAREATSLQVAVRAADWSELLDLTERVAERASAVPGVAGVHGRASAIEHFVLRDAAPLTPDAPWPESRIDRALALAEGDLVLGAWQRPEGRTVLRVRLDPRPAPAGRVLIAGELRGVPALYLRDLGELVRAPVPRWLRLDDEGYVAPLEVNPLPGADVQQLAMAVTRSLAAIELSPRQEILVSGRDDIAAALGPAWRVALLAGLSVVLVVAWRAWRGGTLRSGAMVALMATGVTLVTAAVAGAVGAAPSSPYLAGLIIVLALAVLQGGLLGGDPATRARRPFGRRVLDAVVVTAIALAAALPLTVLPGAAGALLAPLAQVVCIGLLTGLAFNLLFLPAFFPAGRRRRAF